MSEKVRVRWFITKRNSCITSTISNDIEGYEEDGVVHDCYEEITERIEEIQSRAVMHFCEDTVEAIKSNNR